MALVEADATSQSALDAPGLGEIASPGIKCALVNQPEDPVSPPAPSKDLAAMLDDSQADAEQAAEKPTPALASEAFDGSLVGITETHIYLKKALEATCSEEAKERVGRSPPSLKQSVKKILLLTRPFSFS